MKRLLTGLLAASAVTGLYADSLWTETFDTTNQFSLSAALFSDGYSDYFALSDGDDAGSYEKSYTGFDGMYLTGMDMDAEGAALPIAVTWSNINISGYSDLQFSGLFAESYESPGDIDGGDYILVEYQVDGGGWTNLLAFEGADFSSTSGDYNGFFCEDTDFDGEGDGTVLTNSAAQFTKSIAGTGTSLNLRVTLSVDSGDEDFALDSFEVSGTSDSGISAPVVEITYPEGGSVTLDLGTAEYTMEGTANDAVVGTMTWSNALTAVTGTMEASSGWEADVSLADGTNVITVVGTNSVGTAASASAAIIVAAPFDGAGTAVFTADTFRRAQSSQTVELTITGLDSGDITDLSVEVPSDWAGLDAGNVVLSNTGFSAASATVSGNTITISGAAVNDADTGTVAVSGLTTPTPAGVAAAEQTWTVMTMRSGALAEIDDSPETYVTVPVEYLRAVDADGTASNLYDYAAVEGTVTVSNGTFASYYLSTYIQDGDYGVNIYNNDGDNWDMLLDDLVVIKGQIQQYRGLTELVPDAESDITSLGAADAVVPAVKTIAEVLADAENLEGSLITIESAWIAGGSWDANQSLTIEDASGSNLTLRIDGDTNVDELKEPTCFDVTGVLCQYDSSSPYDSGYQLYPRQASDIYEHNHVALSAVSSLELASGSEIVAFDEGSQRAFVTTPADGLVLVDMSDPSAPVELGSVLTNDLINSVAVYDGLVAVAIESGSSAAGSVAFLNTDGVESSRISVGILPDNIVFSPDGTMVITADEAETADHDDYGAGSISVVMVNDITNASVSVLGFESFDSRTNELRAAGVRIFPGRLPSVDFEPEFVAVNDDSTEVLVTLQEANAMAVVDLTVPEITDIVPLGLKDWSDPANTLDAGDKDDGINMTNYPFFGMYMPDTVVSYEVDGKAYYIIANEGDSRDLDDADETRLEDVTLDTNAFPNAETLQSRDWAGRLKISQVDADTDGDGDYDVVYAYGGRSFSILDEDGAMIYDSADEFETYIAENHPELHNVNDCDPDEFDKRSDDKGCEPEAAEVGVINGVTYAFIGLERVGGVMVYNVSNPENPSFVEFVRLDTDVAPEGFDFVSAENSPSGSPLLLVANEDSHTLTVYEMEINEAAETDSGTSIEWLAQYGLTAADDELDADGDGLTTAEEYAAGLDPVSEDTDCDLLPDGYEVTCGTGSTNAATVATDTDGDGQSDIMEYDYGTAPDSTNDYFTTAVETTNSTFSVSFYAAEGHQYVVQESAALETWHNGEVVDGSNETVTVEYSTTDGRFFHVDGAVDAGAPAAKICVISDPHYMAPELLSTNANVYFQAYLDEDRKLIEESRVILESVLASVIAEDPDVLLVPGDLTKDGELVCHEALSNFFAEVEAEGIDVVLCPGNHDINNTNAVRYVGTDSREFIDSITPEQFVENYSHCGYEDAVHADTNSLSFVAEPVDGLWVLSIDSCLYEPTQVTAGEVSDETLDWIAEMLAEAAESGKTVAAMMHHGVVPHYDYQLALFPEYVVSNYEEVQEVLTDGGCGAVFTGHYHANDVVRDDTDSLFDIETGSTVTWPCPYRVIFMTADGVLNVGTKLVEEVEGIDDFQTYAYDYLTNGLSTVSYNMLVYGYGVSADDAAALTPAMVESFAAHYAGDEGTASDYTQYVISSLTSSTNALEQLMGAAISSIWDDPAPADNDVLLNIKTGGSADK